jgi:hypothetical protein
MSLSTILGNDGLIVDCNKSITVAKIKKAAAEEAQLLQCAKMRVLLGPQSTIFQSTDHFYQAHQSMTHTIPFRHQPIRRGLEDC